LEGTMTALDLEDGLALLAERDAEAATDHE
jgi:hypothetical protein